MDIENLTLKQIKQLQSLFENNSKTEEDLGIRIVILQRGWVYIGKLKKKGMDCTLENAYVIRRWGTSRGLGELALEGKKVATVLDKAGVVNYHKLTEVANIKCDESVWNAINE
jgi:hypothetical protein